AGRIVGLGAGMSAVGGERVLPGFPVGHAVARRWPVVALVRGFVMGVAAEVQRIVGVEDVWFSRLLWRFRLDSRLEAAQRLETLFVVDVKAVVGEPDRLYRRPRRRHIGEEVEQAAALVPRIRERFNRFY